VQPPTSTIVVPTVIGTRRVRRGEIHEDEGLTINDRRTVNPDTL
jgi:hypothetical protein